MKIRITINQDPIHIDEEIEGDSEEELFHKFREGAAARAPFLIRIAMKTLSDQALRQKIVESYNQKYRANEPVPATPHEFIAFGERAGFVKRVS